MQVIEHKGKVIVGLSDTHGAHRGIKIPPCDILIHAGDACCGGDEDELRDFFEWFSQQSAKHKIFVMGNHDLPFELDPASAQQYLPKDVVFLDNAIIEVEGLVIVGVTATMGLLEYIEICEEIDILVSHCAPYGIGDEGGQGCPLLRELVLNSKPTLALFGHFHNSGGYNQIIEGIRFLNLS